VLQIARMLSESKARAEQLLQSKLAELHAVAAALVENETLDAVQMTRVCDGVVAGGTLLGNATALAS
jgi:ATP-dependent Zn protease